MVFLKEFYLSGETEIIKNMKLKNQECLMMLSL